MMSHYQQNISHRLYTLKPGGVVCRSSICSNLKRPSANHTVNFLQNKEPVDLRVVDWTTPSLLRKTRRIHGHHAHARILQQLKTENRTNRPMHKFHFKNKKVMACMVPCCLLKPENWTKSHRYIAKLDS